MRAKPILLLIRPEAQSRAFAEACHGAGFAGEIVISPILDIVRRALAAPPMPGTTLIFTSANGVRQATGQADLAGFRAVAVGDRTAQAAREAGLTCTSAGGDVDSLLALLSGTRTPLLHLHGAHSTGDLAVRLRAAGCVADEAVVYDQIARPLSDAARKRLGGEGAVIVPLFSPRSARLLGTACAEVTAPLYPIAISAAAAEGWTGPGQPQVAAHPDGAQMLRAVLACLGEQWQGSALVAREPNS